MDELKEKRGFGSGNVRQDKWRDFETSGIELEEGELYLFWMAAGDGSAPHTFWGEVFEIEEAEGCITLESASENLREFRMGEKIPLAGLGCRSTSRAELRDYTYNRALYELSVQIRKHLL